MKRTIFIGAMACLSVVGWTLHWHLTVVQTKSVSSLAALHKPFTAEMCYRVASIRPSENALLAAMDDTMDNNGDAILPFSIGKNLKCTVAYWSSPAHPSSVSLDLPMGKR